MDFQLNEEDHLIQEMAQGFSKEYFEPFAAEWDEKKYFPKEALQAAAQLGLASICVDPASGGSGMSRLQSALIFEQLSRGCISTSAYLSIHNMVASLINQYADEALKQKWGPKLASMEIFASYCLTEPGAGSDAASLKTRATRDGDTYVVQGSKSFISGGGMSDIYVCMVRTSEDKHHGITCLLIEKETPGLSFGQQEHKLGWRSQPTSMLFFENCRVPISHRIGEEGMGFKIALNALNGGRINIAACSLGGAHTCLDLTKKYMHERKQFELPLTEHQALRFYFADMITEYTAAQLMLYRAAQALDLKEKDAPMLCAMAKRLATDVAFKISDKAMQIHGGYGYLRDYSIERLFRDLRVHQILEGTNEIMREIISKHALDEHTMI
jgi:butyryl-CoA dehydrogenase